MGAGNGKQNDNTHQSNNIPFPHTHMNISYTAYLHAQIITHINTCGCYSPQYTVHSVYIKCLFDHKFENETDCTVQINFIGIMANSNLAHKQLEDRMYSIYTIPIVHTSLEMGIL